MDESKRNVTVISVNQTPLISFHGQLLPFYAYMGQQEVVGQFGPRGIHITNNEIPLGWVGPYQSDMACVDEAVERILSDDPDSILVPRVMLEPGEWYRALHPDELCRMEDGEPGVPGGRWAGVSLASARWRDEASEALARFLTHVLSAPYADHFAGVLWCAGSSFEWGHNRSPHWPELLLDHSPAMRHAFREWLHRAYDTPECLSQA